MIYVGAKLHPGQKRIINDIINSMAMYCVVCTPRQFGKSYMAIQLMLYYAINNPASKLMFCSPVYSQANKVFRELVAGIKDSNIISKSNSAENSIILNNGSEIYFKSVQLPDNLRGYSIDYMFLDEAAMYSDNIFYEILRPMLTVRGKKCILFSTPKGKNYFYDLFSKRSANYLHLRGSSYENPYANKDEIEDARKYLPPKIFKQEYEAEFIDDGGEVFGNINVNSTINQWISPNSERKYYVGIDLGRQDDYTVATIIDDKGDVVYIYRNRAVEWTTIVNDIVLLLNHYKPKSTLIECNGIGDVVFSMIKDKYSNVTAWTTTNQSKQDIIEELILAFQENTIKIPTTELMPDLHSELFDFSFKYSKQTRKIIYSARNGHDDTVMSLAIAHHNKLHHMNKGNYYIH